MWGPASDPAWARHDPTVNVSTLAGNNTRIWVYCGNGSATPLDANTANAGGLGALEGFAIDSNRSFQNAYLAAGGHNGVFNFENGTHNCAYWAKHLQQMKPAIHLALPAKTPTTSFCAASQRAHHHRPHGLSSTAPRPSRSPRPNRPLGLEGAVAAVCKCSPLP
jgi:hypothetical protein